MDVMAFVRAALKVIGGWRAAAFLLAAVLATGYGTVKSMQVWHLQAQLAASERDAAQAAAYAAEQAKAASEAARREEQARAEAVAFAADTYEKGKRDAQAAADRVAADLRAGRERFRGLWAECSAKPSGGVPGPSAGPGEPDAAAADRSESAGRIVRAAAEADAQIRGLQAVIQADRAKVQP